MPWASGQAFAAKHWHKGSAAQHDKANRIASGMIRSGVPEGVAIATGIARAKGQKRKGR
jgi:hypothetical protein